MDENYFVEAAEAVYDQALKATVELFKSNGEKRFLIFEDIEDCVDCEPAEAISINEIPVCIFGLGLDENDKLLVAGDVEDVGYGYLGNEFCSDWTTVSNLKSNCYPELYRFAARNLDSAVSRDEADKILKRLRGEDEE